MGEKLHTKPEDPAKVHEGDLPPCCNTESGPSISAAKCRHQDLESLPKQSVTPSSKLLPSNTNHGPIPGSVADVDVETESFVKRTDDCSKTIENSNTPRIVSKASQTIETAVPSTENPTPMINMRFATKELLGQYIPELKPDHDRSKSIREWSTRRKTMLKIQQALAWLPMFANVAVMIWAVYTHPVRNGKGTIFIGDCSTVKSTDTILHLGLNTLSTLFLGAGNFCLQILVAPSIREVRRAHSEGKSLDIGIPSIRNLRYIHPTRRMIYVAIGVTSSFLHLLWNSAFFTSTPIVIYNVAIVTNDFLTWPLAWDTSDPPLAALQEDKRNLTKLSAADCISYLLDYTKLTGNVIVVSNVTASQNNGSSLLTSFISPSDPITFDNSNYWVCSAYTGDRCLPQNTLPHAADWQIQIGSHTTTGQYCLISEQGDNSNRCGLHFSTTIFAIVSVFLVAECVLISLTAWTCRERRLRKGDTLGGGGDQDPNTPLVTLGDAAAAFLEQRDETTAEETEQPDGSEMQGNRSKLKYALRKATWDASSRGSWFTAAPRRVWLLCVGLIVASIFFGACLFMNTLETLKAHGAPVSLDQLWADGDRLGGFTGYNVSGMPLSLNQNLLAQVLFANMFQLLISFLYLFYNGLLTQQLVGAELLRFLKEKKALRLSSPTTIMQRSSYKLSLPFSFAIPLMVACILLHWFVSRSIFVVATLAYTPGPNGTRIPSKDAIRLGFSATAQLPTLVLGGLMLLALLLLGRLRRYPSAPEGLALIATDSSGISALCHRPEGDTSAFLYPVQIVAVNDRSRTGDNTKVICLSTDTEGCEPQDGEVYWWPAAPKTPTKREFFRCPLAVWKAPRPMNQLKKD